MVYQYPPIPETMPTVATTGGEPEDTSPDPVYLALWKIDTLREDHELGAGECLELIADVAQDWTGPKPPGCVGQTQKGATP